MNARTQKNGLLMGLLLMSAAVLGVYWTDNPGVATEQELDSLYAKLPDAAKRDPKYAVGALSVAEGLQATLFASEPMIWNPTDIDVDARGRVWVCEAYNYRPAITGNKTKAEGDRIMILEDTNGDGKADVSKVFYQDKDLNAPLGICILGNRVIVSQSPGVFVLTDENGDDKADKKEVIFTGVSGVQHDHGMHAFVFGPDGKLYFNYGNDGKQLLDRNGNPVFDKITKKAINPENFKQGVVFRCDPDFTNVEVLGQNFRNNYEVAVDSYGTLWQSDNDDDGNKGVRINYVMEYGNYGYTDELTGAGWAANRTNLEAEIPHRHWHLNDPGVVPNLLQTGAGSPTGILVYEGNMLPQVFQNQIIHCDAGPNVVRSYPTQKDGAGYTARIENILYGKRDQWFRPSDVCVAPDGSLIVADWYDPGVGGHQAGDLVRGRVFRVAPPSSRYVVAKPDFSTTAGAVAALESPNMSARYLAWTALQQKGILAEPALVRMYRNNPNPRMRARALFLLSKIEGANKETVANALQDANPDLRIAALRAVRQWNSDATPYIKKLVNDPNPAVRRECAIALRRNATFDAPDLWAQLAMQHDGKDRWYLEALGIGAAGQWDTFFAAWQKRAGAAAINNLGGKDIVWRARTKASVPMLAQLAADASLGLKDRLRYFRAFDFNPGSTEKSEALLNIIKQNQNDNEVRSLALRHLDPAFVRQSNEAMGALQNLLDASFGTQEYLELVAKYELTTENNRLLDMAVKNPNNLAQTAVGQLLKQKGAPLVWGVIDGQNTDASIAIMAAMKGVGSRESVEMLKSVATDSKRNLNVRREAMRSVGGSWGGEDAVISMLKTKQIPANLIASAVDGLTYAWRTNIRTEAASYLPNAKTGSAKKMPVITDLLAMKGNVESGQTVFKNQCSVCHKVGNDGADFGPQLTEIGSKLPKEAQYTSILYPSGGISFGYEGHEVRLKDGAVISGIVASKTETDLKMKFPGGTTMDYKMKDVVSIKKMDESMMSANLHENMKTKELVDLVEYLMTLKKK